MSDRVKRLFVVEDPDLGAYSMLFYIPPSELRKDLAARIWANGGVVVQEPGCSIYQLKLSPKPLTAKAHAELYASNLIYEAKWVDDCIKKARIVSKKNYIVPNFRGNRQVTPPRSNFTLLECLKMYDTVAARLKDSFSRSLSFWKAIENTGFFPGRSAHSLHNRWKALSKTSRADYAKSSLDSPPPGFRFCNALANVPFFEDRDNIISQEPSLPPVTASHEPAVRKKPRRALEEEKEAHDEPDEDDEEEEEDEEDEEEEDEELPPEEAKQSAAKSVSIAPVGEFLLNVAPRSLHTEFTDSALDEEKSFISGRVTPTLIKTGPLLRFGTIMPIRHASVTWTPDLNDPAVLVSQKRPSLSKVLGQHSLPLKLKEPKGKQGDVWDKGNDDLIILVDSKGKRVAVHEDEEKKVFAAVDKRLHELVQEHPTKTYEEMVELLEEVSGNLGDLEELLDGNDDVHQWDELEDLAVLKPKGSAEYKAIVKKLGEKQVGRRRIFLSR